MTVSLPKVPNSELVAAGLELMRQAGRPLERVEANGRAMIYRTQYGDSVRVRTCNDPVLVVLAETPDTQAALNIEGTDYLLIVMPETPRSRGPVSAYLVPTDVAVQAVRMTHEQWLASNPNTKGQNRTWNIWFSDDGPAKANGFARKWAEYRLTGLTSVADHRRSSEVTCEDASPKLGEVIAEAKQRIAQTAGVPESAVRITIDLA